MNLTLLVGLLTVGGTFFAFRAPTEEELVARFDEAQRFYAEGAYDQAIARYEEISRVRSRILDTGAIQVSVGEETYPVQEAAEYQIGNAYTKLYEEYVRFAGEAKDARRSRSFRARADSAFARAVEAFRRVIDGATSHVLRGQAYGRLVDFYFEAKAYPQVIAAAGELIAAYGNTPYAIEGYYNTGWAYYELKEYARAIDAFESLLERFPTGYRADRSLFQIGECYMEMGQYDRAIEYYGKLVERQRIESLSEEDLRRMKREKLAGLVDETALELAAKAQIRMGTCYVRLGRYQEGLEAYRKVITLFGSERKLVEEAYLRMADLYLAQGDLEASLRIYRQAIDRSTDRILKARIQYALAERLLDQGRFEEAIQEYRVYVKAYSDVAAAAGFSPERARYRIGSAYQKLGQQKLESEGAEAAAPWLERAVAQYDTLCMDPSSSYCLDATFNRALALQSLGTRGSMERAKEDYERIIGEAREDSYVQRARVQLAELYFGLEEYDRAVEQARLLLDKYPDSEYADEAQMRLALSLQAEGDLEGAARAFLAVPEESPYFARARLACGHVYLSQGRYAEAVQVLSAGLERPGEEKLSAFHYLLGQAYSGLKEYEKAMDHYSTALQYPVDGRLEEALHFSRGHTAFLLGEYERGEKDFDWISTHSRDPEKVRAARDALALAYLEQNRGGAAIRVLDEMLGAAESPEEQAGLLARIMDLNYERSEYEETVRVARRLLALEFDDAPAPGRPYTLKEKAYFLLGDALLRLNRTQEGTEVFQEALRVRPDSYFATVMRLNLATRDFAEGRLEQAKEEFSELSGKELDAEQRLLVDFYLANIHYSLREFEEARRLFQHLLETYPTARELPDILFGLGESHYQLGEFEKAIEYYRRLLEQFPDDEAADDAQYNMGWCLIELKREKEAMEVFRSLLSRYPHSEFAPSAQFTLGDYAYNRGAYEEAMAAYQKVLEKYPQAPVAAQVPRLLSELREAIAYQQYERGIAYMDSAEAAKDAKYYEKAIQVFEQVRRRFPGTESELGALSNMGVCLEGLEKWREAVEVYDQVIEMYKQKRASRDAFQFAKAHRDWIVTTRM